MKNYHITKLILDFIIAISWPIVTLIILYILKNPIRNLINNIKKIGYGNTGIETSIPNNQDSEDSILQLLGDGDDESYLDNALYKFTSESMQRLEEIVEKETQISQVEGYQNKYERIYKYSKLLVLIKNFERIYDTIFGSQIQLLQRLNHTNSETKNSLKLFYDKASKYYPKLYEDYSYRKYLGYLFANSLIHMEENNENVTITYIGRDFLRYLLEANMSLEKHY